MDVVTRKEPIPIRETLTPVLCLEPFAVSFRLTV